MKKAGRGATDFKLEVNTGVIIVKWMDNNAVHIASNYVGVEQFGSAERWSKNKNEKVKVQCPQLIAQYNKGMGGVDLADMLMALYCISLCSTEYSKEIQIAFVRFHFGNLRSTDKC